jgi:hypothetical protein
MLINDTLFIRAHIAVRFKDVKNEIWEIQDSEPIAHFCYCLKYNFESMFLCDALVDANENYHKTK